MRCALGEFSISRILRIRLRGNADAAGRGRRCGTRRRTGGGSEAREKLLQIGLQRCVGLLRGRKTSGLESLAERREVLLERGDRRIGAGVGIAAGVMVMMAVMRLAGGLGLLRALLNSGEVLLSGAEIAGLQIFAERLEGLKDRVGARG